MQQARIKNFHHISNRYVLASKGIDLDTFKTMSETLSTEANIDSNNTVSMLEKMKDKVIQEEALAESYGEIANTNKSLDEDIDAAIGDSAQVKAEAELKALKEKMGLN